jgi:hypothetical protein
MDSEVLNVVSSTVSMAEFVSSSEVSIRVIKLKGDRRKVEAFEVTGPRNATTLYKFVLTRIGGETRTLIARRNLENWEELTEFLK